MLKFPIATWIAHAAVGLTGLYGEVTRQAEVADCSRQTVYDHARKVQAAVVDAYDGGPPRATLIAENRRLAQENAQLWGWLAQTIDFPPEKRRKFTVTAAAMGLSLNPILALLGLLLGEQARPGRSTLHRWVKAAGLAAGRALKGLDARCKALVTVGCLDEIFFRSRPVLVGVEPASLAWFLGRKADDRSGATWAKKAALRPGTRCRMSRRTPAVACKRGSPPCNSSGGKTVGRPWRTAWMCSIQRARQYRPALRSEPRGAALGAGGGRQPPGRPIATAGRGCPGRGGRGLEEGRGGIPAVRALRSGLEDRSWRAVGVSS